MKVQMVNVLRFRKEHNASLMKKIFAAIIIASALALTACGNEATESTAVDTVAVDSTAIDSTAELFPAADTTVSK